MPVNIPETMKKLDRFHYLTVTEAVKELLACCGSPVWATSVAYARPFASEAHLLSVGTEVAEHLDWPEILAALAAHPRIGESNAGADRESRWSREEQSGVTGEFARANRTYEEKFGHIYLVCATGRTGPDLMADLVRRLDNDAAAERLIVRRELAKIVDVRLRKLLALVP